MSTAIVGRLLCILALIGVLGLPSAASAQSLSTRTVDSLPLTPADVRVRLLGSPALRAVATAIGAARGDARQARLLTFNPDLELTAPAPAADGMGSPYELSITQEFEVAGQRGLRTLGARENTNRVRYDVMDRGRRSLGDAQVAFFRSAAANERARVAERLLGLNAALVNAVRTQLREGEISALEATLAEIEAGRSRARAVSARQEATSTALDLARQLGLGRDTVPSAVVDSAPGVPEAMLTEEALVQQALRLRPDLEVVDASGRQVDASRRLAERGAFPNLRFGAVAERNRATRPEPRVGLSVGVSVPLFNRNQGTAARFAAERRGLAFEREALRLSIRTEVIEARRALVAADSAASVFAISVLGPARTNSGLLETAYRAGKITLPTLLLLRNQLIEAELGYWDAWLRAREARVRLDVAIGANPLSDAELTAMDNSSLRTTR